MLLISQLNLYSLLELVDRKNTVIKSIVLWCGHIKKIAFSTFKRCKECKLINAVFWLYIYISVNELYLLYFFQFYYTLLTKVSELLNAYLFPSADWVIFVPIIVLFSCSSHLNVFLSFVVILLIIWFCPVRSSIHLQRGSVRPFSSRNECVN